MVDNALCMTSQSDMLKQISDVDQHADLFADVGVVYAGSNRSDEGSVGITQLYTP